jgi:nesprin-1
LECFSSKYFSQLINRDHFCRLEIAKKKEKAKVVDMQQKNYVRAKNEFLPELEHWEQVLQDTVDKIQDAETLKQGIDDLSGLQGRLVKMGTLKDDLLTCGDALLKEDEPHVLEIQNEMTTLLSRWDNLNDRVKQENDLYCGLQQALTAFNVVKADTAHLLSDFEKTFDNVDRFPNNLSEAYVLRETCKELADKLPSHRHLINKLENASKNIAQLSKQAPNFGGAEFENDRQLYATKWNELSSAARDRLAALDNEIKLWQQVEETRTQLLPWIEETKEDLSNTLLNLTDVKTAYAKLNNYKEQVAVNRSLKDGLSAKQKQLSELHGGQPVPSINSLTDTLDGEFNELESISQKLESLVHNCEDKEECLKEALKNVTEHMNAIREKLTRCDDVTGSVNPLCERLASCRLIKSELEDITPKIADIETLNAQIVTLNPNYVNSNVAKEVNMLKKRHLDASAYLNKVESTLGALLKQNFKDKLTTLENAVKVYSHNINLCLPEEDFDQNQLLSKLDSLKEIEIETAKLEDKKHEIDNLYQRLESNNVNDLLVEFSPQLEKIFVDLSSFSEKANNIETVLRKHINMIENYDTSYGEVSADLNKLESQVNQRGRDLIERAKIDVETQKMDDLLVESTRIHDQIEKLKATEAELSRTDFRPKMHNVDVLEDKSKSVNEFLKNRVNKLNEIIVCLSKYDDKVEKMEAFLANANSRLDGIEGVIEKGSKNPDVLKAKLNELKGLSSIKEEGVPLLNEITELSDTLFPELVPEDRDAMRTTLKTLRGSLEASIEKWNNLLRRIESTVLQKAGVEENAKQILEWIASVESKVEPTVELQETLPEKRKSVSAYRTLLQDVHSHKPIVEQLIQKMESIPCELETNPSELSSRFARVKEVIVARVDALEKLKLLFGSVRFVCFAIC